MSAQGVFAPGLSCDAFHGLLHNPCRGFQRLQFPGPDLQLPVPEEAGTTHHGGDTDADISEPLGAGCQGAGGFFQVLVNGQKQRHVPVYQAQPRFVRLAAQTGGDDDHIGLRRGLHVTDTNALVVQESAAGSGIRGTLRAKKTCLPPACLWKTWKTVRCY